MTFPSGETLVVYFFVSRKEEWITKATIELAFEKAIELKGKVSGPKSWGYLEQAIFILCL